MPIPGLCGYQPTAKEVVECTHRKLKGSLMSTRTEMTNTQLSLPTSMVSEVFEYWHHRVFMMPKMRFIDPANSCAHKTSRSSKTHLCWSMSSTTKRWLAFRGTSQWTRIDSLRRTPQSSCIRNDPSFQFSSTHLYNFLLTPQVDSQSVSPCCIVTHYQLSTSLRKFHRRRI